MEDDLNPRQMEDNKFFFKNRRQHRKFQKRKTISKMKDDFKNGKRPEF